MGMGAAGLVVESAEAARERGIQPICEVLSSVTANSAFHGTRLDVEHIGQLMESLVAQAEARGVRRHEFAPETVFVSHETYTPARGGSAAAEINALRQVFGADADRIVIANTKGFTGHPMGVGIEDVVAVKALETGLVPPIPNFRDIDPELGQLNLSTGGAYPVRFALRLAAGFGSQISMTLLRWTPVPDGAHREPTALGHGYRVVDPAAWGAWLRGLSGQDDPQLEVVQRRLRVVDRGWSAPRTAPAAPAVPVAVPAAAPVAPVAPVVPVMPAVPAAPAAPAAAAAPAGVDPVVAEVLSVVSEKTGYPQEMLDLDLDLEADLGVDTVKQAEVFAAIRETFAIERDDSLQLRDYPTLTHVVGFVRDRGTNLPAAAPAAAACSRRARRGCGPGGGGPGGGRGVVGGVGEDGLPAGDAGSGPGSGGGPGRRHGEAGGGVRRDPGDVRDRAGRLAAAAGLPDADACGRVRPGPGHEPAGGRARRGRLLRRRARRGGRPGGGGPGGGRGVVGGVGEDGLPAGDAGSGPGSGGGPGRRHGEAGGGVRRDPGDVRDRAGRLAAAAGLPDADACGRVRPGPGHEPAGGRARRGRLLPPRPPRRPPRRGWTRWWPRCCRWCRRRRATRRRCWIWTWIWRRTWASTR